MRIAIKIGSSVLVDDDGKISDDRLKKIVDQISAIEENNDVAVVSSGAIATGASVLGIFLFLHYRLSTAIIYFISSSIPADCNAEIGNTGLSNCFKKCL